MENKPDYLFTVFKNNDLVTLLNSLQIMTKVVLNIGYCCSDRLSSWAKQPGVISHPCKYYSWRKGFVQCYQRQRYYARYYHGFDDKGKLTYYWINTSLGYQATNEHLDCIVVSQNICIRETVKKYILND